ncbi:MAG: molecular chaperone HtpG, partial [Bacteroidota bacterium]
MTHEFKAEMQQLLHLIVHSLYTHPEVFLRELVSNASDALNKARFLQLTDAGNLHQHDAPLEIRITVDEDAGTFAIEDTGIGMTETDLVERLGTVASSGTLAFLKQRQEEGKAIDGDLIGQFGVGFYSAFMVTDEVTVETRHAQATADDAQGFRWTSDGKGTFEVESIEREARGTAIRFTLNEDHKEFAKAYRVRDVIRRYSSFVDFPIFVNGEQANDVKAIWYRSKNDVTEEERTQFYRFITGAPDEPIAHLHLALEGRVSFRSLLFVPGRQLFDPFRGQEAKHVHLYANRVFIQDDNDRLLPEYLRFLAGVVDAEDLPLNVSREVTQASPLIDKIREVLTKRVIGLLEDLAKKDAETYARFYDVHGQLFLTGLQSDFTNRERLLDLARFGSTTADAGARTSLADYVSRMPEAQTEIYYLAGENREAVLRSPALEGFKKRGYEVLLLTDPVEVFLAPTMGSYDEKSFRSIEDADLDLAAGDDAEDAPTAEESEAALNRFKAVLGDRVKEVRASKRLVDSAVTLVTPDAGMSAQLEQMMRAMDPDNFKALPKILEVNLTHPVVAALDAAPDELATLV